MKKKTIILSIVMLLGLITYIINKNYSSNELINLNENIAIYVDDKKADSIPSKDSGYILEKYECSDDAKIRWNYETWSLIMKDFRKGTKCTYYFKKGHQVEIDNRVDEGTDKEDGKINDDTIGVTEGTKVKDLAAPSKEGYTFEGWYDENGNPLPEDAIITEGMHIVAKWTINTYTLTIKPNGGTINGSVDDIVVNLRYKEEYNINNISKKGHTLKNYSIDKSTTIVKNNVVTMGSDDTIIEANWQVNSYTLNLKYNCNNREETKNVNYNETIEIAEPTCEGYTYSGYDLDKGTYENNKYTATDSNATLSFKWTANKYPYIVRHNKQNVNGSGYTLVAADTLESTATFNTTVTPDVKSYTGFTSPAKQTLTIKVDDKNYKYNKIDYNYSRNKYTLTINPNGGNFSGNKTRELYYEQTSSIETPTKTCYTFVNWTASSGTMTDNTFKMGTSNATITANYQLIKYTLTYNVNGGNPLSTNTKTINCGETIGTLPTPTKTNSQFDGWYTAETGGEKVTSSTSINKNTAIYAHWTSLEYTVSFNANGGSGSMANQTHVYGSSKKLSKSTFTKSLNESIYAFDGWAETPEGTVVYSDEQSVTNLSNPGGTKTLYAKYKVVQNRFYDNNSEQDIDPNIKKIACEVEVIGLSGYPEKETWITQRNGSSSMQEHNFNGLINERSECLDEDNGECEEGTLVRVVVIWEVNKFVRYRYNPNKNIRSIECIGYSE